MGVCGIKPLVSRGAMPHFPGMFRRIVLLSALALAAPPSVRADDAAAGEKIFARCKVCHTLEPGGPATLGPNLHHVYGRKAGASEGYKASETMKNSGIVWDEESLGRYLRDPKGAVPGNRMAFPGIKNDRELSDLLAYLKQATQ